MKGKKRTKSAKHLVLVIKDEQLEADDVASVFADMLAGKGDKAQVYCAAYCLGCEPWRSKQIALLLQMTKDQFQSTPSLHYPVCCSCTCSLRRSSRPCG